MKNYFKLVLFFITQGLLTLTLQAQTSVSGNLIGKHVWKKTGSPYTITSSTNIMEGSSVSVEPGVTLMINDTIRVFGEFNLMGSVNDSIFISESTDAPQGYIELAIDIQETGKLQMNFVSTNGSISTMVNINSQNQHSITNSKFSEHQFGFYIKDAGELLLCTNTFVTISVPVYMKNVDNCLVQNNTIVDGQICITSINGNNIIRNNYIINALRSGIEIQNGGIVEYNEIYNSGAAIRLFGGNDTIRYNKILDNTIGIAFPEGGTGGISLQAEIYQNEFCNEMYNVDLQYAYGSTINLNLSNNCWCIAENLVTNTIYQPDPSKFTLEGVSQLCNAGKKEFYLDCNYTPIGGGNNCLPKHIFEDLTLTKAGSPYRICDSVFVEKGAKLILEPGVTLYINELLTVYGELLAQGQPFDSVYFSCELDDGNSLLYGIQVLDSGKVEWDFAHTSGNIKHMLNINANNNHSVTNSHFGGHMDAIRVNDHGRIKACSNTCNQAWSFITLTNVDSCLVTNNYVNKAIIAISSRYGVNQISNNTVLNASRSGIEVREGAIVRNNDVSLCKGMDVSAIRIFDGGVKVLNNNIHDNEIGLSYELSSLEKYNVSIIEENQFCNNGINAQNISNDVSLNLSNNCWCKSSSEVNTTLSGSFVIDSIKTNCQITALSGADCKWYINSIESKTFSISGNVHAGSHYLATGLAFLYSRDTTGIIPLAMDEIINGSFNFVDVDSGKYYTVLAGPRPENISEFVPTFYVNKKNATKANYVQLNGNISGLDLYLQDKIPTANGSEYFSFSNSIFTEELYPILLLDANTETVLNWYFSNEYDKFEITDLDNKNYLILTPQNGAKDKIECLEWQGEGHFVKKSNCAITGLFSSETRQLNIFPNPVYESINFEEKINGEYEILDELGVFVKSGVVESNVINVDKLNQGIYILRLKAENGNRIQKFVKMN